MMAKAEADAKANMTRSSRVASRAAHRNERATADRRSRTRPSGDSCRGRRQPKLAEGIDLFDQPDRPAQACG